MRVLVCGGRDYADKVRVFAELGLLDPVPTVIIHGAAQGADSLASAWARAVMRREERFPADWARDGKAAGAIRNQRMLDEGKPDLVLAFPGGRGTADMVRRARKAGVPVREIA